MARIAVPMTWAELKRGRLRDCCVGYTFLAISFGVFLVGVLKAFYEAGSNDPLSLPMFVNLGNLAVAAIRPVWWVPVIPPLWQLNPFSVWVVAIALSGPGWLYVYQGRKKAQTMRDADQQAQEDHLIHERLGYPQPSNIVNVTAQGDIRESVIGTGSGANVAINSAHNSLPLPEIAELVSLMYTHFSELASKAKLTPAQLRKVEAHLRTAHEQLEARTPNHPLLRMSLSSIQHIVEIGTAHALVGHWRDILHALQRITGS
jgi:hypothetical protein